MKGGAVITQIKTDVIQTIINLFAMGGTLLASIVAAKALSNKIPLISFIVGTIGREQDPKNKGYRIDVTIENVGYSPANVMVIDAVSPDIYKTDIGVPTIFDKSVRSVISIWLKESNKPVKVAIALYYFDIRQRGCYRTVSHMILKYSECAPQDVFRMDYQRVDKITKKRFYKLSKKTYQKVPNYILQWDGERKSKEKYFSEDWLMEARNFVSSEISPIMYYHSQV